MTATSEELDVCTWSERDFLGRRAEWQALLETSAANPLFMSWDWLHCWWRTHQEKFGLSLDIVAVYSKSSLVGIAPMTLRKVEHRGLFRTVRLEFLGHLWRESHSAIGEYLDVIADSGHRDAAERVIAEHLAARSDIDEIVFANTRVDSSASRIAEIVTVLSDKTHLRVTDETDAHLVSIKSGFDDYVMSVNTDTRRKMFRHRARSPDVALRQIDVSEVDSFLRRMNEFLKNRWGSAPFTGTRREFHTCLAASLGESGDVILSEMSINGIPVSLMYDVCCHGVQYNLQSAFRPDHDPGITPSYLHLGYTIEEACGRGLGWINLLAGRGKRRDYKRDFSTDAERLHCIQLLVAAPGNYVYKVYDRLRSGRGSD